MKVLFLVTLLLACLATIDLVSAKYGQSCNEERDCEFREQCREGKCVCFPGNHYKNGECRSETFCVIDSDCEVGKSCNNYGICSRSLSTKTIIIIVFATLGVSLLITLIVITVRRGFNCNSYITDFSGSQGATITHVPPATVAYPNVVQDPLPRPQYSQLIRGIPISSQGEYISRGAEMHGQPIQGKPIEGVPLY
jgi:hypothetical protein